MRTSLNIAYLTILLSSVNSAFGGQSGYQCTVSKELQLQSDGALKQPPKPLVLGQRFAISRSNGALVGPESSFWSYGAAETAVLSKGNHENSFVVSVIGTALNNGVHATFIRIEEFATSQRKPFLVMAGGTVYSGTCE